MVVVVVAVVCTCFANPATTVATSGVCVCHTVQELG